MGVYEGSMEIDDCDTGLDRTVFSILEDIGVCNRNIAYLMKEKKVFSYGEEDFEPEDRLIKLKKMRNLINYGFDALSAYLLDREGYDGLAIDLVNEQMPYDEIAGILLLQDNDKNIGMPVIDDMNMEIYDEFSDEGSKAIDTLVQLEIIETKHTVFDPKSEFYQAFKENEITLRNIKWLVREGIKSDIEAKYENAEDREIIVKHISSYIKDGIDPVSAATEVIDVGIKALDEIYSTYRSLRDSEDRYSPTEAFDKTFNCENLTRKILEQRRS
ncbi:MAG: hypothetical protein KAS11_03120 [Candidatus Aenigmarchaeota archaeon]|nr:hypothetical protein [Candidatus Aenigmarchaeota archaeon]